MGQNYIKLLNIKVEDWKYSDWQYQGGSFWFYLYLEGTAARAQPLPLYSLPQANASIR